jgi:excisionase family DNA binding protein
MMLTVKAVANRLGVSLSLIYKKVEEGELKAHRFGKKGCRGAIRISEDDLRDFLDRNRPPPPDDDGGPPGHID